MNWKDSPTVSAIPLYVPEYSKGRSSGMVSSSPFAWPESLAFQVGKERDGPLPVYPVMMLGPPPS